jgi:hypothetical protein
MASSPPTDQAAMMKDILEALKTLQMNQVQLASSVDAISGRVNVLAGMKEIRDVGLHPNEAIAPVKRAETEESHLDEQTVPESPSLPAITSDVPGSPSHISALGHTKKTSTGTSRIILTRVLPASLQLLQC